MQPPAVVRGPLRTRAPCPGPRVSFAVLGKSHRGDSSACGSLSDETSFGWREGTRIIHWKGSPAGCPRWLQARGQLSAEGASRRGADRHLPWPDDSPRLEGCNTGSVARLATRHHLQRREAVWPLFTLSPQMGSWPDQCESRCGQSRGVSVGS